METVTSSLSKQKHVRMGDGFFAARAQPQPGFTAIRTNESGIQSCMEDPGLNYQHKTIIQSSRNDTNDLQDNNNVDNAAF